MGADKPAHGFSGAADAVIVKYALTPTQIEALELLFYAEGYRGRVGLDTSLSPADAFAHYLAKGVGGDVAPGPMFDSEYCRSAMPHAGAPIVVAWLQDGLARGVVPTPYFDAAYYRAVYADARRAKEPPFLHFLRHGRNGARIPSPTIKSLVELVASYRGPAADQLWRALSLLPPAAAGSRRFRRLRQMLCALLPAFVLRWLGEASADRETIDLFRRFVQPSFYAAQLPPGTHVAEGQHAAHCLVEGLSLGLRPAVLFNPEVYRKVLAGNPGSPADHTANLFLHWLYCGLPQRILPTPLFDEPYYLERYPLVKKWRWPSTHVEHYGDTWWRWPQIYYLCFGARWRSWSFVHFLLKGLAEGRTPHPLIGFNARTELTEPDGACPDIPLSADLDPKLRGVELATSSRIEISHALGARKLARLDAPDMQALIAHAAQIDPEVRDPRGGGELMWPPHRHHVTAAVCAARTIRRSLAARRYDAIAFAGRMGDPAGTAMAALEPSSPSLLLVLTDNATAGGPAVPGTNVEVLDLTSTLPEHLPDLRALLLLDLVRGLRPSQILTIGSAAASLMVSAYGTQLAQWTQIHCALTGSAAQDRDANAAIEVLRTGHAVSILVKSQALKDALIAQHALPPALADRLRVARPASGVT